MPAFANLLLGVKSDLSLNFINHEEIDKWFVEKTKSRKAENKYEISVRKTVPHSSKTHQSKYPERQAYLK